jgi:hypothetical protein
MCIIRSWNVAAFNPLMVAAFLKCGSLHCPKSSVVSQILYLYFVFSSTYGSLMLICGLSLTKKICFMYLYALKVI